MVMVTKVPSIPFTFSLPHGHIATQSCSRWVTGSSTMPRAGMNFWDGPSVW